MPLSEFTIAILGPFSIGFFNVRLYFGFFRMSGNFFKKCRESKVRIYIQFLKSVFMLFKNVFEICLNDRPEDDRIRNLHHRRLQMCGKQDVFVFRFLDSVPDKGL